MFEVAWISHTVCTQGPELRQFKMCPENLLNIYIDVNWTNYRDKRFLVTYNHEKVRQGVRPIPSSESAWYYLEIGRLRLTCLELKAALNNSDLAGFDH